MSTAEKVANYFLALQDHDAGDSISHMKLQKLVYYAQGVSLALRGEELFPERVEAWDHGPVVPDLYHRYKEHGSSPIPKTTIDADDYTNEEIEILDEVYEVFGQFSAWKLRNMTHQEPPWKDAYNQHQGAEITREAMKAFFDTMVDHGEEKEDTEPPGK